MGEITTQIGIIRQVAGMLLNTNFRPIPFCIMKKIILPLLVLFFLSGHAQQYQSNWASLKPTQILGGSTRINSAFLSIGPLRCTFLRTCYSKQRL